VNQEKNERTNRMITFQRVQEYVFNVNVFSHLLFQPSHIISCQYYYINNQYHVIDNYIISIYINCLPGFYKSLSLKYVSLNFTHLFIFSFLKVT